MADKDEGLHMLQIALDNLQIVLPNTSVPGRDNLRREMQGLQAEYDALSGDLNELKTKLDGTLAQWTVYDDSIEQLHRWLPSSLSAISSCNIRINMYLSLSMYKLIKIIMMQSYTYFMSGSKGFSIMSISSYKVYPNPYMLTHKIKMMTALNNFIDGLMILNFNYKQNHNCKILCKKRNCNLNESR
jgi:uncharacterized membrane protein YdfJ with MMPL/SSD domain